MSRNENEYTIYIRSTGESIPATKEEFDLYYHDIDVFRKAQQRHGRCVCPQKKQLACDMDCATCPFRRAGDTLSLDFNDSESDDCEGWVNRIPDDGLPIEEIIVEAEEVQRLYRRVCELMPEAVDIGNYRLTGMPDAEIQKHIGINDSTFQYRIKKLKSLLAEEFPEFF